MLHDVQFMYFVKEYMQYTLVTLLEPHYNLPMHSS